MIEARGLTKRYGDQLAVDDLSFTVRDGSVTGFLGPNGAGKSTAMRLMLGLDSGGGTATFDGRPYRALPEPLREVGVLLEAKAFHPTRSARNHLRMLAAAGRIPDARVDELLALVGLESVARKKPKGFSLGMAQRLGLASALLGDPKVLILDEPANGLDPQGITWLRGFLQSYAAAGRAVLVSSHLLSEMALMADHLVVIGQGRLISDAPVADFISRSSLGAVMVRGPEPQRLTALLQQRGASVTAEPDGALAVAGMAQAEVGEAAFAAGLVLHELSSRVATLEQAFLEATADAQDHQAQPVAPQLTGAATSSEEVAR